MPSAHSLRRAITYLAAGGAWFDDTVLRLDPEALLLHSKDSTSYAAMRGFTIRGGGRAVSTMTSGRLWAHIWVRDRDRLDSLVDTQASESLLDACVGLYSDLFEFAGLEHLREEFATFTAPTALLRAFDRLLSEPDLDLTPLERLTHPGEKLRAVNMLSDSIRLPEAVLAVEAAQYAPKRVNDEFVERWARAARQFLAAGASMDESLSLVMRVGWKHPARAWATRGIPDDYWRAMNGLEHPFESKPIDL